ncbi:hypothetical protein EYF80_011209 [Liparis tanakae]|uniref:Uncharacterized protein n=1 Tax=Liparis tanakae TaxID=230148 RepID=A0A4Z2IMB2_9TELE|nr:hypothetical protein EYF80_011209 [Liparis tanakae]
MPLEARQRGIITSGEASTARGWSHAPNRADRLSAAVRGKRSRGIAGAGVNGGGPNPRGRCNAAI